MDLMQLRRRIMMQARSSEYEQLPYLFGDGRQRIITDIEPGASDIWIVDCQYIDTTINSGFFGSANGSSAWNSIGLNASQSGFFVQIGGGNNYKFTELGKDTNRHLHTVDLQNKIYSIDSYSMSFGELSYTKTNNNYGLFFHNTETTLPTYKRYTGGFIYSCEVVGRGKFVPCKRISDGEIGMLCLQTKTFYPSIGEAKFSEKSLIEVPTFNDCWLATATNNRSKADSRGTITDENGAFVCTRTSQNIGLCFAIGYLSAGESYLLSGNFSGIDGNAYFAKVAGYLKDIFNSTRVATQTMENGQTTFTPSESGLYEVLIWGAGTGTITASDIHISEIN